MKRLAVLDDEKCIGCQNCMFACARRTGQGGLSGSRIGVRSKGGIEHGFAVIVCRIIREREPDAGIRTIMRIGKAGLRMLIAFRVRGLLKTTWVEGSLAVIVPPAAFTWRPSDSLTMTNRISIKLP